MGRGVRGGAIRDTPFIQTVLDFIASVIAPVGDRFKMAGFPRVLRADGHRGQLSLVRHGLGDLMGHAQLVLLRDGQRHIVTAVGPLVGLHRPTLSVSEGDGRGATGGKMLQPVVVVLLARLSLAYLFCQLLRCRRVALCFNGILLIQCSQRHINLFRQVFQSRLKVFLTEMPILMVDGLELTPSNGTPFTTQYVESLAAEGQRAADVFEGMNIGFTKIRAGVQSGGKLPESPQHLDITLRLLL